MNVNNSILTKLANGFLAAVMLVAILFSGFSSNTVYAFNQLLDKKIYLPLVLNQHAKETPKMLGVTAQGYWGTTTNDVQTKLKALDTWAGKKHTIVGWFFDIVTESGSQGGTDFNFKGQLENLWVNGYVSFVNLGATGVTAAEIANGKYDKNLSYLAQSYADFVNGGPGRRAFIAPLQEMNGYWVPYKYDPVGYKLAYERIQSIFISKGIDAAEIWWTFAPNGWSEDWNGFELYYPGDDKVDVVSYSSYNYGFCPVGLEDWRKWADYSLVHQPYIERMRRMAPNKPIIVAQTATTAQYPSAGVYNTSIKNTWLIDSYNKFADEPGIIAILYFDINKEAVGECDFEIYNGQNQYNGYKIGVSNAKFTYYDPVTLSQMDLMETP